MSERIAANPAEPWPATSESGQRSPLRAVAAMWRRHGDIVRNALSLLATTGVTSGIGFAYWDVAARLFISHHTVSGHLKNVFTKLAINSRVELVRIIDLNS